MSVALPLSLSPPRMPVNVLWFRHGLRLHDNPALHEAVARMKG